MSLIAFMFGSSDSNNLNELSGLEQSPSLSFMTSILRLSGSINLIQHSDSIEKPSSYPTTGNMLSLISEVVIAIPLGWGLFHTGLYMTFARKYASRERKRMENYLAYTVSMDPAKKSKRDMHDERDKAIFDFPSLPPEIRIHIAKYALSRRDVYLPQIRKVASLDRETFQEPNLAKRFRRFIRFISDYTRDYRTRRHEFQPKLPYTPPQADVVTTGLLAANKQTYQETHGIYWSTNRFHLARSDYRNSEAIFENISPEHTALINGLTIDMSLADLTPQLLQHRERKVFNELGGRLPHDDSSREWSNQASMLLRQIWIGKICWVKKYFKHVPCIFISCFEDPITMYRFHGNQLKDQIKGIRKRPQFQKTTIGRVLMWAITVACNRVRDRVQHIGWENFKEELAAGDWGRRKDNKWCSEPSKIRY